MAEKDSLALVDRMLAGDTLALARLITMVENRSPDLAAIMDRIHPHAGRAYSIGITGPPGAGKSTIADGLVRLLREKGDEVGVVAIDPSSPFSGGAVLGDRIRMQRHATDPGVFIRSIGTRGSHGGLARATKEIVCLFDAFGKKWVLIETVGVGQTELAVADIASTTIVVLVPEAGDTVQTMKAGLTEIADVFVVNKADRPGAEQMAGALETMVSIGMRADGWKVPVVSTRAFEGIGIDDLLKEVLAHRDHMARLAAEPRNEKLAREVVEILSDEIRDRLVRSLNRGEFKNEVERLREGSSEKAHGRSTNPYGLALDILDDRALLTRLLLGDEG